MNWVPGSTVKRKLKSDMGKKIQKLDKQNVWEDFTSGNSSSFKQLFEKYFDEMYGYGMKLCNKPHVVKDCIQELFKTVWERRKDLDHINSPNVYLFVSLRREILRSIKKEDKERGDMSEIDEGYFLSFSMEEIIITDEVKYHNKKELRNALNQLTPRQKEVIFLHYYNGMSYDEITQIMSINRQSVRNCMYRGMETLRALLNNEIMKLVISLFIAVLNLPV